jgi:tetratricopeptide (TPR) repeat protein
LQLEADHPTVRANLANVYQDLGRYDLAIATFAQVLVEHPGMTDVHYSLGRVYQEAGRANEAIEQYQALPLASPQRKFADNNIGTIFQVAGKIDSALYYYGRAGQFVQARSNRARLINGQVEQVKHLLDRGQFLDAENLARLLRTADGSHRDAHFMLAVALFLQKRYDESSAVNRRLVEEHPRFDEGFLQLALVQESSGRLGDAQVTYQTLIAGTGREEMRQIGTERLRALEERMP